MSLQPLTGDQPFGRVPPSSLRVLLGHTLESVDRNKRQKGKRDMAVKKIELAQRWIEKNYPKRKLIEHRHEQVWNGITLPERVSYYTTGEPRVGGPAKVHATGDGHVLSENFPHRHGLLAEVDDNGKVIEY